VQNTAFSTNKTLNLNGQLVDLSEPRIMGILNVTPDSFYDGGRYQDEKSILARVEQMQADGAAFVDVGGYSSRPGASDIPESVELQRIVPVVGLIAKKFPSLFISIDTFRSAVARAAIDSGASLVNDISGGSLDDAMYKTIASSGVPYVLMHMKGTPQTMNANASYDDLLKDLLKYFQEKVHQLGQWGIKDVIIDPGFGFAKTREHNFEILAQLEIFRMLGKPIMAGLSRKSMVWKTLNIQPEEALNGSTVLNTIALLKGVDILRVHDVKEAVQVIRLVTTLKAAALRA
jgi:dihydropteroate synthase